MRCWDRCFYAQPYFVVYNGDSVYGVLVDVQGFASELCDVFTIGHLHSGGAQIADIDIVVFLLFW